jgi:2-(1,2-epoxy-1,2-dihydrophenyl)acetyl-CoA isomerase
MSGPLVLIERANGVARVILNRPDRGNAFDMAMADAFHAAVTQVSADTSIRCVFLSGNGKLFCAGGDVGAFAAAGADAANFLRALAARVHESVLALATMAKPLVVGVHGPAAGAGLSLALLGDIVIAGQSAHFTAAYSAIGLTPDGGMSWLLPRVVGLRRAQEMLIANRRVGAEEAAAIGLITRVVEDSRLPDEALAVAERLAEAPVAALSGARALLLDNGTRTLADHLAAEARRIGDAGDHPESREGIAAFLARRTPDYRHV